MLPGMNHNIMHNGRMYHIQTEDGGRKHPYIVSHLFLDGVILASEKTSYEEHLELPDNELRPIVIQLMSKSHRAMINRLVTGGYDHLSEVKLAPEKEKAEIEETPSIEMKEVQNADIEQIARQAESELQENSPAKQVESKEENSKEDAVVKPDTPTSANETFHLEESKKQNVIEQEDPLNLYVIFGKKPPQQKTIIKRSIREQVLQYLASTE